MRLFGKAFLDRSHFWTKNIHELGVMCHQQTKLYFPEHPAPIVVHAPTPKTTTPAPTRATTVTTSTTTTTVAVSSSQNGNATKVNASNHSNSMMTALMPSIVLVIPPILLANSNFGMNFTGQ
jgi:hypothetical protein